MVVQQVGFLGIYKVEIFWVGDNIEVNEPLYEDYVEFFSVRSVGVDKLFNNIKTEEDIDKLVKIGVSDYIRSLY